MPDDGTHTDGTHDDRRKGLKDGLPGLGIDTDIRRLQAVQLRRDGMTYEVIGKELGCSRTHAFRLVNDGWAALLDTTNEERRILRAIETENLDRVLAVLLPIAHADTLIVEKAKLVDGEMLMVREEDVVTRLKVVDRLLKVGKRYADLHGLDIPVGKDEEGSGKQKLESLGALAARVATLEHEENNRLAHRGPN